MDNIYKKNINLNGLTKQQQKLCKYVAPSRRSGQLPWGFWRRVRDIIFWHTAAYVFSSGKDLARVSMPAPLNEPLNLLQRLCEELEYSELLDTANHTDDPYQRMVRPPGSMNQMGNNAITVMLLSRNPEESASCCDVDDAPKINN